MFSVILSAPFYAYHFKINCCAAHDQQLQNVCLIIENAAYKQSRYLLAVNGQVILDPIPQHLVQCDNEIWLMTSKNSREPLLCPEELCVSFCSHTLIWIRNTNRKRSNRGQIVSFWHVVTSKFDGWPRKTIGNLCYFKRCASYRSHQSIPNGVTLRKCPIWVKIGDFRVPCDIEIWRMTLKTLGHLFYGTSSFVHDFEASCEFKLELRSVKLKLGANLALTSVNLTVDF